jgi:hypothetical protein
MVREVEQALSEAKRLRSEGRADESERGYVRAADLARANGDQRMLAHALRHVSDLERERGAIPDAWEHACEATVLYRGTSDRLGLANALRLQAIAAPDRDRAQACWREARELYASLDVEAGVRESDRYLLQLSLQSPN